jgi:lipid-A-disaccharide synthase
MLDAPSSAGGLKSGEMSSGAVSAQAPRLALVAGETSGDLLAGLLLDALKVRWPGLQAEGIGGPRMQARGFKALWSSDKLSFLGFLDVLLHYREIVGIRRQLKAHLLAQRPDVFIGVDAPDFNLDLEASLRAAGIKTVQFVSPSVWASRPERVEKIKRSADHVLCLFPFEPALLAKHGIDATYVGHPLAGMIPMQADQGAARLMLGLATDRPVVAVLPGSRQAEIDHLAPCFFKAVALIARQRPGTQFIVPALPRFKAELDRLALAAGVASLVKVVEGQSHAVLAACDVTLIASGTATLEAALFKRPMVIAYRMNRLSWWLKGRLKLQPWVGLPNILCGEFVVPELLQDAATPSALAGAVIDWLQAAETSPAKIRAVQDKFTALHVQLQRDTAQLATDAIDKILEG